MRAKMVLFIGAALAAAICLIVVGRFVIGERAFDACVASPAQQFEGGPSPVLRVGIIGDSWVADHKLDPWVIARFKEVGIQVEVMSSGQPGAVSRQIYRNLVSIQKERYSADHYLNGERLDFLVVVAGVNDTVEHIGREFYAHHMLCIIRAIQSHGIHPVVLEVPEYGIRTTPSKSFLNYSKRLIYRMLFDGNTHDVIDDYRVALTSELPTDVLNQMTLVSFDGVATDYDDSMSLYEDPNHLSRAGYEKLGRVLADAITQASRRKMR